MDGMTDGAPGHGLPVPQALVASHDRYFGAAGRRWLAALPTLLETFLARWRLRPDGPATCGAVALVLPVVGVDGTPAVLKAQPVDEETAGEPLALRAWDGHGAVRLLAHDADSGTMLLERLDADRSLGTVPDDEAALRTLAALLARLVAVPAPPGLRHLRDIAADMLERVPRARRLLPETADRRLLDHCAGTLRDLLPEPGDRLLHWDLHDDNVLASRPSQRRERWLAIDPKPLAGDPGFELLPALRNRWPELVASGDVPRAVRRRFDLMTEVVGLPRQRAVGWTLARVLQQLLWLAERPAAAADFVDRDRAVAHALLARG